MSLVDLFPPPKYMTLAEAGVSVDERSARIVTLNPLRCVEVPLPPGVVAGGVVVDKIAFAKAFTDLKNSGLKFVSAAIPEEKAYLFTTKVESATYRDLSDAVAFTVEENAPVKLASSVHSFEYVSEPEESPAGTEAVVTVLPLDAAKSWSEAFGAAGLELVSVDLRAEAVARALTSKGDTRMRLILDLGETKTGFYLVESGLVRFSSSAPMALSGDIQSIDSLKAEVRKVFLFAKDKKIEHIDLTGSGAGNEAAVATLLSVVDTPYSVGNVWANIRSLKKKLPQVPFEESLKYAAAIGSALPPINHLYV